VLSALQAVLGAPIKDCYEHGEVGISAFPKFKGFIVNLCSLSRTPRGGYSPIDVAIRSISRGLSKEAMTFNGKLARKLLKSQSGAHVDNAVTPI
jgi:hypothetical protein